MTEVHAGSTWPSQPSRTQGLLARGRARVQTADAAAGSPFRRRLQVGLGLVWLLDAALQFQPYMFTKDFPNEVIAPTGQGSPGWVEHPVTWAANLMAGHIVVLNALFALTQFAIAVGIVYRRTVRPALWVSIVWSLAVWWLGEGLGGMLAGAVSPLKGAPGAVLIYLLIAVPRLASRLTGRALAVGRDRQPTRTGRGTGGLAGAVERARRRGAAAR